MQIIFIVNAWQSLKYTFVHNLAFIYQFSFCKHQKTENVVHILVALKDFVQFTGKHLVWSPWNLRNLLNSFLWKIKWKNLILTEIYSMLHRRKHDQRWAKFHEIFLLKKSQYISNNFFNPLQTGALFLYPLQVSENLRFRGYEKETPASNNLSYNLCLQYISIINSELVVAPNFFTFQGPN